MPSSLFPQNQQQNQPKINQQLINKAKGIMGNLNSPEMKMIMGMLGGKSINAEQLVRSMCAKQGIDANSFINGITSMMK